MTFKTPLSSNGAHKPKSERTASINILPPFTTAPAKSDTGVGCSVEVVSSVSRVSSAGGGGTVSTGSRIGSVKVEASLSRIGSSIGTTSPVSASLFS